MRHGRAIAPLVVASTLTAQPLLAGPGTTTTTTLPACTAEPTFESADCRLADLIAQIEASADLGKLQLKLLGSLDRSAALVAEAEQACDTGDTRVAAKSLRKAVRRLIQYGFRLRSLATRRTVPEEIRGEFIEEGRAIQKDLMALRRSLVCPSASPSGAFIQVGD